MLGQDVHRRTMIRRKCTGRYKSDVINLRIFERLCQSYDINQSVYLNSDKPIIGPPGRQLRAHDARTVSSDPSSEVRALHCEQVESAHKSMVTHVPTRARY